MGADLIDELGLRVAAESDLDEVLAILSESASWLARIGVEQWPSPFPRSAVENDFKHHTVWLATIGSATIATASILAHDPMFWGDLGGKAWYLHRFAVRRDFAGVGRTILELIEREAVVRDVEYVRLDCGRGLQTYYEAAGYRLRSSVSLLSAMSSPPRSLWYCYEKELLLRI